MTLGENVRDAQRVVESWSPEKRANVQLEGRPLADNQTQTKEN
jgi:hypothetical protein